jgi:hypothetical protein
MEITLLLWRNIPDIPLWTYLIMLIWYFFGIWAMGAMLSVQIWDGMSYQENVRWFWIGALGGPLFLLLVFLNGDLGRGHIIPSRCGRRQAEKIQQYYEDYCRMLKKDPSLPTKYGVRRWDEIWRMEKFSAPF